MQDASGAEKSIEFLAQTAEAAPFVIDGEYDASGWTVRTIASGKLVAGVADGGRLEITFDKMRLERDYGCDPVSGSIKIEFFKKGSQAADSTRTTTFSRENKAVFSTGKAAGDEVFLDLSGCAAGMPKA